MVFGGGVDLLYKTVKQNATETFQKTNQSWQKPHRKVSEPDF